MINDVLHSEYQWLLLVNVTFPKMPIWHLKIQLSIYSLTTNSGKPISIPEFMAVLLPIKKMLIRFFHTLKLNAVYLKFDIRILI